MVVPEAVNASSSLVQQVGQVGLWLKAIGGVIVLWIIFQSFTLWFNWKRFKEVAKIKDDMKRIENKINKLLKKK